MTEPTGDDAETIPPEPAAPAAAETRRLYAADWAAFATWCRARQVAALPAAPATLAAYLQALAATLSHGTLGRRAAAVAGRHRRAGHPSPGTDPAVQAVLRATRRAARRARTADVSENPVRRAASPGPDKLARMAARCPGDRAGLRDRALLLLTASGLGGERLLALDCEHVRFSPTGVTLTVCSPDRPAAENLVVARNAASAACPVRALETWLHGSDTRFGPVFRKVNRWGGVEHERLRPDGLRRIVRRHAQARPAPRRTEAASA